MIHRVVPMTVISLSLAAGFGATVDAASVTVATWTANPNTGGGPLTVTGTLGSNGVTLLTTAVFPNAGSAFFEDWTASVATNGYVTTQSPTSGNTSIAIAEGASTTETVTFTTAVLNPVLLIDFGDSDRELQLRDAKRDGASLNHAMLNSGPLPFPGATDSDSDGAAIQVNGTFSTFSFTATDSGVGPTPSASPSRRPAFPSRRPS